MKSEMKTSKKFLVVVLTAITVLSVCAVMPAMGDVQPTVTRSILPSTTVNPGDELLVTVTFTAPIDIDATIIDQLQDPGDWNIRVESGPPFCIVMRNNTVMAVWSEPIKSGSVIYRLTVPSDAAGPYYFQGELKWSNKNAPTAGDGHVTVVTGVEEGSIAGTITYACNATEIEGATVKLTTQGGAEVASTTTDANGKYGFTGVPAGDYYVNASKLGFWDNSTDVTVTEGVTTTADMMLRLKGDLNNNGGTDIGDVAKVANMVVGNVPEDPKADFNGNGDVDIGDAAKIANYFVGNIPEL